jgi:triosephosphate isomerase (TIM)
MKKLLIVANWKSYKTIVEAKEWLEKIGNLKEQASSEKKVILCPSFPFLSFMATFITEHNVPFVLGAQDISPFSEGAYTGAVNARQVKEFVEYVIIGHSERRRFFREDEVMLSHKVQRANETGLQPIFCVQGKEIFIPPGVEIVAYEPLEAIGTGNPDTPENAFAVAQFIKKQYKDVHVVLYGGSVTPENVVQFTEHDGIDGVLVGGASLNADSFLKIVENA